MSRMTKPTYDKLKATALIVLPALATLYGAISLIWGLPHTNEIVATITAVDVFLGTVVGVKSHQHNRNNEEQS